MTALTSAITIHDLVFVPQARLSGFAFFTMVPSARDKHRDQLFVPVGDPSVRGISYGQLPRRGDERCLTNRLSMEPRPPGVPSLRPDHVHLPQDTPPEHGEAYERQTLTCDACGLETERSANRDCKPHN